MERRLGEIEQAVKLSMELAHGGGDAALRGRVMAFIDSQEKAGDAWRVGLELFRKPAAPGNEQVRFFGLRLVVATLQEEARYEALTPEERRALRGAVLQWVDARLPHYSQEPAHVRNKVAVIVALLVKRDFPAHWADPFGWLLSTAEKNVHGAEIFLQVLGFITEEVVAYQADRHSDEFKRNMQIKDEMRKGVLTRIVAFWLQLLQNYKATNVELVQRCLSVMEGYIPWIDLNLVVNDQFVPLLFHLVGAEKHLRGYALRCFIEMVRKGMDHKAKVHLIHSLKLCACLKSECERDRPPEPRRYEKWDPSAPWSDQTNSLWMFRLGNDDDDDDGADDEDEGYGFRENVSILVNEIGLQLIEARVKLPQQQDAEVHAIILEELSNKVIPLALYECLDHADQNARENCLGFLNKMVSCIREAHEVQLEQSQNALAVRPSRRNARNEPVGVELDQLFREVLPQMLPIISRRVMYPEGFTFDRFDEDEAEFELHRKELCKLFKNVTAVAANEAVLPFLRAAVHITFRPEAAPAASAFMIELVLTQLFWFGDGAPPGVVTLTQRSLLKMAKQGNRAFTKKTKHITAAVPINNESKAAAEDERRATARKEFAEIVAQVHRALRNLSHGQEACVRRVYNEVTTRYAFVLTQTHKDLLPAVLQDMVGRGGIQHGDPVVRSPSCYLLLRIVKFAGIAIQPFAADLLGVLESHLLITYDAVVASTLEDEQEQAEHFPLQHQVRQQHQQADPKPMFSVENTINLIEIASVLIALDAKSAPNRVKEQLAVVSKPLHASLEEVAATVAQLGPDSSEAVVRRKYLLGNWACENVRAITSMYKALPHGDAQVVEHIAELFQACLEAALRAMGALPTHTGLRSKTVTLLHSYVKTMGERAINVAPAVGLQLLENSRSLEDLLEAIQFITQLIPTFKERLEPALDPVLLRILRHVTGALASREDPFSAEALRQSAQQSASVSAKGATQPAAGLGALSDYQLEYRKVKRALFMLLGNISENSLDQVLFSPQNSPHLVEVLQFLVDGLGAFPDPQAQKYCCKCLTKLSELWLDAEQRPAMDVSTRNTVGRFVLENAAVASFRATSVTGFSLDDFECVVLLDNIARFHKVLYAKLGHQWLVYLSDNCLQQALNCPQQLAQEYAAQVGDSSLSVKQLRAVFNRLFLANAGTLAAAAQVNNPLLGRNAS
ncbi:Exportin-T (Exportin(tRNA)) (tRNA exportin) [Durusdinium trenchii]|uniref:Exportin-T n=1 Tax=Durusdinium trenchii TaxID=1381693 RepID=A0ABP0R0M8_9DINO